MRPEDVTLFELKAAHLQHHHIRWIVHKSDERKPDVPRCNRSHASLSKYRLDELHRRALPIRPSDSNERRTRGEEESKIQLGEDLN